MRAELALAVLMRVDLDGVTMTLLKNLQPIVAPRFKTLPSVVFGRALRFASECVLFQGFSLLLLFRARFKLNWPYGFIFSETGLEVKGKLAFPFKSLSESKRFPVLKLLETLSDLCENPLMNLWVAFLDSQSSSIPFIML